MNFKKGQKLIIELNTREYFTGTFYSNYKDTCISLTDVKDLKTQNCYDGTQTYYKSEIKNLKLFDVPITNGEACNGEISSKEDSSIEVEIIQISSSDLENIRKNLMNRTYIKTTDVTYHDAIKDLKKQRVVGLSVEGSDFGRNSKTSLLTFSTNENIYIFDVICFGKIFKPLKEILEANYPRKIVHNSSKVADNLKHCHKIMLKSVFDPLIADEKCLGTKTVTISLPDIIEKYLKIPVDQHKNLDFSRRDKDINKILEMTCNNVAYLLRLEEFLTEKMLKQFYNNVEKYLDSIRENDDIVATAMDIAYKRSRCLEEMSASSNLFEDFE